MHGSGGSAFCIPSRDTVVHAADGVDTWQGRNEVDRSRWRADAREGRARRNRWDDKAQSSTASGPRLTACPQAAYLLQVGNISHLAEEIERRLI